MTRREALRRDLPILGIFRSFAVLGVDPAVMGIGPSVAIPAVLSKAGLSIGDIDLFEINEAFASQATYCVKHLGIEESKVNVNGGAIGSEWCPCALGRGWEQLLCSRREERWIDLPMLGASTVIRVYQGT